MNILNMSRSALLCVAYLLTTSTNALANTTINFETSWDGYSEYSNASDELNSKHTPGAWRRIQSSTPSGSTGPCGASWMLYFETSSGAAYYAGNYTHVASPNTTSVTSVSFNYHMYGANIGTLAFEVSNDGNTWTRVWEKTGQQHTSCSTSFSTANIDVSSFASSKRFRFTAIAKGGYRGDISIDNINYASLPNDTVTYQYDVLGRLVCVKGEQDSDRNYQYDDAGNRSAVISTCDY